MSNVRNVVKKLVVDVHRSVVIAYNTIIYMGDRSPGNLVKNTSQKSFSKEGKRKPS